MVLAIAVIAVAYLIGSIPFSYLVARASGVTDVRRVGSGNVGATNVLRSAGRGAGAAALGLDVAKGALAVAVAQRLAPGHPVLPAVAAGAAVVGHVYPLWLGGPPALLKAFLEQVSRAGFALTTGAGGLPGRGREPYHLPPFPPLIRPHRLRQRLIYPARRLQQRQSLLPRLGQRQIPLDQPLQNRLPLAQLLDFRGVT